MSPSLVEAADKVADYLAKHLAAVFLQEVTRSGDCVVPSDVSGSAAPGSDWNNGAAAEVIGSDRRR